MLRNQTYKEGNFFPCRKFPLRQSLRHMFPPPQFQCKSVLLFGSHYHIQQHIHSTSPIDAIDPKLKRYLMVAKFITKLYHGGKFTTLLHPGLRTRSNFIRVQPISGCPSSSLSSLFYLFRRSSSSSTKISFFEFKFEFRQMNIQNRDNFFTAGAHAIKMIKYFARAVGSRQYLSCLVPSKLLCCGNN